MILRKLCRSVSSWGRLIALPDLTQVGTEVLGAAQGHRPVSQCQRLPGWGALPTTVCSSAKPQPASA